MHLNDRLTRYSVVYSRKEHPTPESLHSYLFPPFPERCLQRHDDRVATLIQSLDVWKNEIGTTSGENRLFLVSNPTILKQSLNMVLE